MLFAPTSPVEMAFEWSFAPPPEATDGEARQPGHGRRRGNHDDAVQPQHHKKARKHTTSHSVSDATPLASAPCARPVSGLLAKPLAAPALMRQTCATTASCDWPVGGLLANPLAAPSPPSQSGYLLAIGSSIQNGEYDAQPPGPAATINYDYHNTFSYNSYNHSSASHFRTLADHRAGATTSQMH